MELIRDPLSFQRRCRGRGVGFIPTMGALHEGHLSLVRASVGRDRETVASIFVNPTQFGPSEDLERYPRPFERDCALLEREGVAVVFAPEPGAMYLPGDATRVEVDPLGGRMDGASRPGHFRGVATVVLKLLLLADAARAYFGQKDAAQVAVIRRMARDLFVPTEIVVCPIVRDADGLALSSRNVYLSAAGRQAALALPRAIASAQQAFAAGERDAAALLASLRPALERDGALKLDYLVAVDADTLLPVERLGPGTLVAVAAWVGTTRLIDNVVLR